MKKIISVLFATSLMFLIFSCGPSTPKTEVIEDETEKVGDFDEMDEDATDVAPEDIDAEETAE